MRTKKRAIAPVTVLATGAMLALAACGGPASSTSGGGSTSGVVNLTWQTMWSGNTLTLLSQMVNEFNSTHPNIHVTEQNIPSATGDAKLQSEIAAGDAPDVFTEWNPVLGQYAATGEIKSLAPYLTGKYANLSSWLYPIAAAGGTYNGSLYALPMGMNSWALYYNKSMLAAAGISSPPTTLAELYADQAKEWKISGNKVEQIGFYPLYQQGMEYFDSFFGAVNCFDSAGKYNLASCPGAQQEAQFLASYDKYPYSAVAALESAYGTVAGGDADVFVAGKDGCFMSGPGEGAQNIPVTNSTMSNNFGVIAFPGTVGGPSTFGQGNYNIIPKGAAHPAQAFEFMTWLAGFDNESFISTMLPKGGWMPTSPQVAAQPTFKSWASSNSWLSVFIQQMSRPLSETPKLTASESAFMTAETTASEAIAERSQTWQQALTYIDNQANNTTGG
ncbi:MAG: extracellular solute-binding protein [Nocardiopsaceae bacterium]|jgi:multiple sugar transport system substrate-binding protein|nr:extracellular solute-binding protein [Nocardiopsaceae bacterium]